MRTMIDGEPGMLVHPDCRTLRKGLAGAYCYKRIQVGGQEKYRDTPDKNMYSHVCDAGQYLALGSGEGKKIIKREPAVNRPTTALLSHSIYDYEDA
jgi:hypothetical protein